eukprot:2329972-Rhodomonas_salina.2
MISVKASDCAIVRCKDRGPGNWNFDTVEKRAAQSGAEAPFEAHHDLGHLVILDQAPPSMPILRNSYNCTGYGRNSGSYGYWCQC